MAYHYKMFESKIQVRFHLSLITSCILIDIKNGLELLQRDLIEVGAVLSDAMREGDTGNGGLACLFLSEQGLDQTGKKKRLPLYVTHSYKETLGKQ